jgi:hypothetical protein
MWDAPLEIFGFLFRQASNSRTRPFTHAMPENGASVARIPTDER